MRFSIVVFLFLFLYGITATKVGISVIVKNERYVIGRLLSSIKDQIDVFVFCDTGSSDGTVDYLLKFLKDNNLDGMVAEHEWKDDFSYSRNLCLKQFENRTDVDYIMLADADFELHVHDPNWKDLIQADYNLIGYEGSLFYRQALLISSKKNCSYVGAVHEYIGCFDKKPDGSDDYTAAPFDSISFTHHQDGTNRATKFERDARILSNELKKDPNNTRNTFYLARTYEDLGKYDEAIEWYKKRANIPNSWYEEVWYSLYKIGICKLKRQDKINETINDFLDAYNYLPSRAESLFYIAQQYRIEKKPVLCLLFGLRGMTIEPPTNQHLFIERSVYEWMMKDEVSQCLFYIGKYKESMDLMAELIDSPLVPETSKTRIRDNIKFPILKLDELRQQQQNKKDEL